LFLINFKYIFHVRICYNCIIIYNSHLSHVKIVFMESKVLQYIIKYNRRLVTIIWQYLLLTMYSIVFKSLMKMYPLFCLSNLNEISNCAICVYGNYKLFIIQRIDIRVLNPAVKHYFINYYGDLSNSYINFLIIVDNYYLL